MKAHVQYSQSLAVEFSHLIKDYEELVEVPEVIELDAQDEFDLEAVCAVFEELIENEPIVVLRELWPCGLVENAEERFIDKEASEHSNESAEELVVSRTIRTKKCITSHKKKVHSTRNKQSSISKKRFSYSDLKRRAKYHAGNKLFECAVCGKRLGNKSKLETHTRVHTGEKPFKCLTCSKRFNQKHHLDRHTKSQHGD